MATRPKGELFNITKKSDLLKMKCEALIPSPKNQKLFKLIKYFEIMKIEIDTKHDSNDDIRSVIRILRHLVGDQELVSNQPVEQTSQVSPMANIFGESPESTSNLTEPIVTEQRNGASDSNSDLFADLFSESEIKKMDKVEDKDDHVYEEKKKSYGIELY